MTEIERLTPLPRDFYDRDAETVARATLGTSLVYRVGGRLKIGRVVETEAYLGPHDLAAHSARGRTARTEVMFGPPGFAYVYLIYGVHHCLNVVTGAVGHASAVLFRAIEPLLDIEGSTNGPGRLCRALGIDRTLNGHDFVSPDLFLALGDSETKPRSIVARPRIGVDYAGAWAEKPLRFYLAGNPFVSKR